MDIAIISSEKDLASMNIRSSLLNNFDFRKSDEKFDNNESYNLKIGDNSVKLFIHFFVKISFVLFVLFEKIRCSFLVIEFERQEPIFDENI